MFLPSDLGHDVEGNVGDSVAFCTTPEAARRAPGARQFPGGFVVSAHFRRSSEYVQVAGRIDQRKYEQGRENWGRTAVNGETGLSCSGYARFVNFVDPDAGLFCIRCCNGDNHKFCSSDQSELGCEHLVNGDYEPQGDRPNPPSQRLAQTIAKRSSTVDTGETIIAGPALSFSKRGALAASVPENSSTSEGSESPSALAADEKASSEAPKPRVPPADSSRSSPLDNLGSQQSHETGLRFPSVASPTFRFVTTTHEGPLLVSANSGCVDLDPGGSLDWSALNRSISYASVAIPGGVGVSILFFVEEDCAGIAVYDLEKKTIATGLPTVVDILPDFFGNFLGPQSAAVSVTKP